MLERRSKLLSSYLDKTPRVFPGTTIRVFCFSERTLSAAHSLPELPELSGTSTDIDGGIQLKKTRTKEKL